MTAKFFAGLFGLVYLAIGVWGMFITGFTGFAAVASNDQILGLFTVNPLHNLVHLLVGVALLAGAAGGESVARGIVFLVAAVYAVVGVLGFFIQDSDLNYLALDLEDNLLHLGTAVVGFLVLASGRRTAATTQTY